MIFHSFRNHVLWACQKHIFAVQFKEIRTFPHLSIAVFILCQSTYKFPFKAIFTSVKKNLSASISRTTSYNTIKVSIFFFPDFWVTEIYFACAFRQIFKGQDWIFVILHIILSISHSHRLCLNVPCGSVLQYFPVHSCIHKQLSAVLQLYGTSGKAAHFIVILVWCQCCREIVPMQQILTYHMPPVHAVPMCVIWIVLIKQMVFSLIAGKSIGIIHPSNIRSYMKSRSVFRFNLLSLCKFIFSCLF